MGLIRMGPPPELVLALQARLRLEDFVETGTYLGDTAAWAAAHFSRVATIELSTTFHAKAQERFRSHPHVRALNGNSAAVLREIVPALTGPALFWLDAHWSGLDTAGREAECPLLEEIVAINATSRAHVVLVDDARLFCAPPPRPHRADHWPDMSDTIVALVDGGRRYVVLFEDVLIAVPNAERGFLSVWMQDEAAVARSAERRKSWWRKLRT